MARFIKLKKQSIGIAPEALVFRGEAKIDTVRIRQIQFSADILNEYEFSKDDEFEKLSDSNKCNWLNIDGLHDTEFLAKLGEQLSIEKIIIANVLETHSRPKFQKYKDCIFINVKMLQYNSENKQLYTENLVLILRKNLLITFQEKVGDLFEPVRNRLRENRKRIRNSGVDYLAFTLIDIIIDSYLYIISQIGYEIESLDDEVIGNPTNNTLKEIIRYKAEINYLRKVIKPVRELIINLVKEDEVEFIEEHNIIFYKELEHNVNLANDSLDSYRSILSDQLNVYHANMSNKLNEVLKVLTLFSVIFIPITFVAGIYGTNFAYIPELQMPNGYFIMWGVIIAIAISMFLYFKQKKWL